MIYKKEKSEKQKHWHMFFKWQCHEKQRKADKLFQNKEDLIIEYRLYFIIKKFANP